MKFYRWFAVAALAFATACSTTTHAPNITDDMAESEARMQREIAVDLATKRLTKADKIAHKIFRANAELCEDTVYLPGARLAVKKVFPKDLRDTYSDVYGISSDPTVHYVLEGWPAAEAGLRPGDKILSVNGKKAKKKNLYEIMTRAPQMTVKFKRGGEKKTLNLQGHKSCASVLHIDPSDALNAIADGTNIIITNGMLRFTETDDELALIIGHELGHNAMGHIKKKRTNAILGTIVGAVITGATGVDVTNAFGQAGAGMFSQKFESEADYVGTYYAARAGYDVSDTAYFWRRMAAEHPQAIHLAGSSHPSTAKRFLAIEQTVAEIDRKDKDGVVLVYNSEKNDEDVLAPKAVVAEEGELDPESEKSAEMDGPAKKESDTALSP